MDTSYLSWLMLLGLGFPCLSVILGEAGTYLERRRHPLAKTLRYIRNYLLLPLATLLVMQQLLQLPAEGPRQVVATLTLLALMVVSTTLVNGILTTGSRPQAWQVHVPNLFFQVVRSLVVLGIGYYLLTGVWQIDLDGLLTAVGVGSLVIALALQDTLSNLVSGLLLLIAAPFKVGDWISFGTMAGRVKDQNWWSVTVTDQFKVPQIIPNGTLAKASITNLGQGEIFKAISFRFSYDDAPNEVIPVLAGLIEDLASLESVRVACYGENSIEYHLCYFALPEDDWLITGQLMPRIYYAAKRHSFRIPYPIEVQYNLDPQTRPPASIPQTQLQPSTSELLQKLPFFAHLDLTTLQELAKNSRLLSYGVGEIIIQEGREDGGFYIVMKGSVRIYITNQKGQPDEIRETGPGDFFGETAIFPGELSLVTVVAKTDIDVVVIPDAAIVDLIQTKPKASAHLVQFFEDRKQRIYQAKSMSEAY